MTGANTLNIERVDIYDCPECNKPVAMVYSCGGYWNTQCPCGAVLFINENDS